MSQLIETEQDSESCYEGSVSIRKYSACGERPSQPQFTGLAVVHLRALDIDTKGSSKFFNTLQPTLNNELLSQLQIYEGVFFQL